MGAKHDAAELTSYTDLALFYLRRNERFPAAIASQLAYETSLRANGPTAEKTLNAGVCVQLSLGNNDLSCLKELQEAEKAQAVDPELQCIALENMGRAVLSDGAIIESARLLFARNCLQRAIRLRDSADLENPYEQLKNRSVLFVIAAKLGLESELESNFKTVFAESQSLSSKQKIALAQLMPALRRLSENSATRAVSRRTWNISELTNGIRDTIKQHFLAEKTTEGKLNAARTMETEFEDLIDRTKSDREMRQEIAKYGHGRAEEILALLKDDSSEESLVIQRDVGLKLAQLEPDPVASEVLALANGSVREVPLEEDGDFAALALPNEYYLHRLAICLQKCVENPVRGTTDDTKFSEANRLLLEAVQGMERKSTHALVPNLLKARQLMLQCLGAGALEVWECDALLSFRLKSLNCSDVCFEPASGVPTQKDFDEFRRRHNRAEDADEHLAVLQGNFLEDDTDNFRPWKSDSNIKPAFSPSTPFQNMRAVSDIADMQPWFLDLARYMLAKRDIVWCSDVLNFIERKFPNSTSDPKFLLVQAYRDLDMGRQPKIDALKVVSNNEQESYLYDSLLFKCALQQANVSEVKSLSLKLLAPIKSSRRLSSSQVRAMTVAIEALAAIGEPKTAAESAKALLHKTAFDNVDWQPSILHCCADLALRRGDLDAAKRWLSMSGYDGSSRLDAFDLVAAELSVRSGEQPSLSEIDKLEDQSKQLSIAELSTTTQRFNQLVNLALTASAKKGQIEEDQLINVVAFKGLLMNALARKTELIRLSTPAEKRENTKLFADYQAARSKLSKALIDPAFKDAEIENVMSEKENIEHNFQDRLESKITEGDWRRRFLNEKRFNSLRWRSYLSDDEVFVDIHKYYDSLNGQDKYCAIIITPAKDDPEKDIRETGNETSSALGTILSGILSTPKKRDFAKFEVVSLGTSARLEKAIDEWLKLASAGSFKGNSRSSTRDIRRVDKPHLSASADESLSTMQELLRKPLEDALKKPRSRILICPDAKTFLTPWDLVMSSGKLNLEVAQVDSAREFVRLRKEKVEQFEPRQLLIVTNSFSNSDNPIPFTEKERKGIEGVCTDPKLVNARPALVDSDATPPRVLAQATNATYLHIATHGFYLQSEHTPRIQLIASRSGSELGKHLRPTLLSANPLLRSGLLLAPEPNDQSSKVSVLTAEEILATDLSRCDLVSLSACETGLGEIVDGQGLLGLRSAFLGAGARSVLASLWPVDDKATSDFMKVFYQNIIAGEPKIIALRKAQEAVKIQHPHPFYWAGWVLSGESWPGDPTLRSNWRNSLSESLAEAKGSGKLVYVDVYSTDCGYCKKMELETYTDPQVLQGLNKEFVYVRIDGERGDGPDIARAVGGIEAVPAQIVIDPKQMHYVLSTGFSKGRKFIETLDSLKQSVQTSTDTFELQKP